MISVLEKVVLRNTGKLEKLLPLPSSYGGSTVGIDYGGPLVYRGILNVMAYKVEGGESGGEPYCQRGRGRGGGSGPK